MREIRFRIWDGNNKHFVFPDILELERGLEYQQFTGLKDKNGREIYEGDILLIPDEYTARILDDGSGPVEPFNHLSEVIFDNLGGFGVNIKEHGNIFNVRFWSFLEVVQETGAAKFEVIGNLYQNPELLEKKEGKG